MLEVDDEELLTPPTFPREGPIVEVPNALEAPTLEEVRAAQTRDTWCQDLMIGLECGAPSSRFADLLWDDHGILSCKSAVNKELPHRWAAPADLRERILTLGHYSNMAAHPGAQRMYQTLSRKWYWPCMSRDCTPFVRRCPSCAARQLKRGPKRSTPLNVFPPDGPLEFVAMDILGPFPVSQTGSRYILVISDRFSKLSVTVPLPNQTATTVSQAFVDSWLVYYGVPLVIITDNGSNFASKFFGVITNMLGVKHVYISAYRPSTNGQVERFNATLADTLVVLTNKTRDWDKAIGFACHAYNTTVHSSTGYAPCELSCTRTPSVAAWTSQPSISGFSATERPRFRHQLLARVSKLVNAARVTNLLRIERYKRVYDAKVRSRGIVMPGDSVFVKTFLLEPSRTPKLAFPVAGPYPVVQIDGPQVVIKTRDGDQRVHLDRVIRCPMDLTLGIQFTRPEPVKDILLQADQSDVEYVIDLLVAHALDEDGTGYLMRVRWAGYDQGSDAWEPAIHLPGTLLRRYERRKRLKPGILTSIN
jgi:transposase InsO family protein